MVVHPLTSSYRVRHLKNYNYRRMWCCGRSFFPPFLSFFFFLQKSDKDHSLCQDVCIVCSHSHNLWQSWSEGAQGQVRGSGSQNSLGTQQTISIFRYSCCRGNLGLSPSVCILMSLVSIWISLKYTVNEPPWWWTLLFPWQTWLQWLCLFSLFPLCLFSSA